MSLLIVGPVAPIGDTGERSSCKHLSHLNKRLQTIMEIFMIAPKTFDPLPRLIEQRHLSASVIRNVEKSPKSNQT